jgi:hypothetical protein
VAVADQTVRRCGDILAGDKLQKVSGKDKV